MAASDSRSSPLACTANALDKSSWKGSESREKWGFIAVAPKFDHRTSLAEPARSVQNQSVGCQQYRRLQWSVCSKMHTTPQIRRPACKSRPPLRISSDWISPVSPHRILCGSGGFVVNRDRILIASVLCLAAGVSVLVGFCHGTAGFNAAYPFARAYFQLALTTTGLPAMGGFFLTALGIVLLIGASVSAILAQVIPPGIGSRHGQGASF